MTFISADIDLYIRGEMSGGMSGRNVRGEMSGYQSIGLQLHIGPTQVGQQGKHRSVN